MDKITKEQRSILMSKIRGKNTKPEVLVFEALKEKGVNFETHYKLLGNPDIVFPEKKVVVFVDGDFWHGWVYKSRKDKLPEYWVNKIKRNMARDRRYNKALRAEGWVVIRVWEHQILKNLNRCLTRILKLVQ